MSLKIAAMCGALVSAGCSEPTDLGANSGWLDIAEDAEPEEPQTIYENERERVFGLAMDDARLYALVEHNGGFQLTSCPVDRCRSERSVLYDGPKLGSEGQFGMTPLVLAGGFLAWIVTMPAAFVARCSAAGCQELSPFDAEGGIEAFGGDADGLYWTERTFPGALALWGLRWDESTPARLRELPTSYVAQLVPHGNFVYYATEDAVYRVQRDGSAGPETLARDEQIHSITAGEDALFYTTRTLAGRVVRCPWSSNTCEVSSLVSAQRFPGTLQQVAGELFWTSFPSLDAPQALPGRLVSCELPECADPRERASGLRFSDERTLEVNFSLNGSFAVWVESRDEYGVTVGSALRSISR